MQEPPPRDIDCHLATLAMTFLCVLISLRRIRHVCSQSNAGRPMHQVTFIECRDTGNPAFPPDQKETLTVNSKARGHFPCTPSDALKLTFSDTICRPQPIHFSHITKHHEDSVVATTFSSLILSAYSRITITATASFLFFFAVPPTPSDSWNSVTPPQVSPLTTPANNTQREMIKAWNGCNWTAGMRKKRHTPFSAH